MTSMTYIIIMIGLVIAFITLQFIGSILKRKEDRELVIAGNTTKWISWGSLALALVITIVKSYYVVPEGKVYAFKFFGEVQPINYTVGLNWVYPWFEYAGKFDVRNDTIEFYGDTTLDATSGNGTYFERFDLNVPYRVNEKYAYTIIKTFSNDYKIQVTNVARSAARTVFGRWDWKKAISSEQKQFALDIKGELEQRIKIRLIDQGVLPEIADNIFIFSTPEVRKIVPPQAIRDANAENESAIIEQTRQKNLTLVQREIAKREAEKGRGIYNMIKESGLNPDELSANEVSNLLHAQADMERAQAMGRISRQENSPIKWVLTGGNTTNPSIAVPGN